MTKTLIDVDDALLRRAMEVTGAATKKAVVNEALALIVRRAEAIGYVEQLREGIAPGPGEQRPTDGAQR